MVDMCLVFVDPNFATVNKMTSDPGVLKTLTGAVGPIKETEALAAAYNAKTVTIKPCREFTSGASGADTIKQIQWEFYTNNRAVQKFLV